MNKVLGYRLLVLPLKQPSLANSWLWIPEEQRAKVQECKVIQIGKFRPTKRRTPIEVKVGDHILVDTDKGSMPVKDVNRMLKIISYHDCLAILEDNTNDVAATLED